MSTKLNLTTKGREGNEEYDTFVDKFKTKLTTDDCYTPQNVYDVILDFVGGLTDLTGREVVRPFFPGGNYADLGQYPDGCIVVDNPPFSILAKIIRFYCAKGIEFFLFGPSLTLFTAADCDVTYIIADAGITYENGAIVRTGFITNIPSETRIWLCPELGDAITAAQATDSKKKRGFVYPDNIVTAATLQKIVAHGVELKIAKASSYYVSNPPCFKATKRGAFGGAFFLSERAAAERAAAERAAAERAAAERAAAERAAASKLILTPKERALIAALNKRERERESNNE